MGQFVALIRRTDVRPFRRQWEITLALPSRYFALGELSQDARQLLDGGSAVSTVYTYDNRDRKSI